jgi:curved DNA-binding protein CbpA
LLPHFFTFSCIFVNFLKTRTLFPVGAYQVQENRRKTEAFQQMADYYQILGLPRQADTQAIRSAYKKLALQYHPDRNPDDPTAEELFKQINEAYHVLIDTRKKSYYDLQLSGADVRRHSETFTHYTTSTQRYRTAEYYRQKNHNRARYVRKPENSPEIARRVYGFILLFFAVMSVVAYFLNIFIKHQHSRLRYEQGMTYLQTNDYNLAYSKFNESVGFDKNYPEAYFQRGQILLNAWKSYEKARQDFDIAIRLSEHPAPAMFLKRGFSSYQLGDYEPAIVDFSRIIGDKELGGEALFFRANSHKSIFQTGNACYDWKLSYQTGGMPEALDSLNKYCPTE